MTGTVEGVSPCTVIGKATQKNKLLNKATMTKIKVHKRSQGRLMWVAIVGRPKTDYMN